MAISLLYVSVTRPFLALSKPVLHVSITRRFTLTDVRYAQTHADEQPEYTMPPAGRAITLAEA